MKKLTLFDLALWATLPIAHTPKIEERLKMILDTTHRRTSSRRVLRLAAVTGAVALVPLSALRLEVMATPPAPLKMTVLAEAADMQRERQYVWENSKFLRGQGFSVKAAAAKERQITAEPEDYTARLCLLGYYLNSTFSGKPLTSSAAQPAYRQQVFWLIRSHPESLLFSRQDLWVPRFHAPAAFEGDKAIWQAQIAKHPGKALILGNAAGYYALSDKALGEEYLRRAQALEPTNPEWPDRLGELYLLRGPHPSAAANDQALRKAFAEYETAANLERGTLQTDKLTELASLALAVDEYDKARQYANALLDRGEQIATAGKADPRILAFTFPQSGDDIHEANSVLGQLALHDGDIAGAEAHLLAMGRISGSRVLDAAGPNMRLAQDLLECGDRKPVLAYFDECAKFWKDKQLSVWRSQVEQGQVPDFRRNRHD